MKPVDMRNEEPFFLAAAWGDVELLQDACRRFVVFRVQCSWRLSWRQAYQCFVGFGCRIGRVCLASSKIHIA
ncbi:MAG: hypothetical protein ACLT98_03695 [Eggerthellaceae bacterium]